MLSGASGIKLDGVCVCKQIRRAQVDRPNAGHNKLKGGIVVSSFAIVNDTSSCESEVEVVKVDIHC